MAAGRQPAEAAAALASLQAEQGVPMAAGEAEGARAAAAAWAVRAAAAGSVMAVADAAATVAGCAAAVAAEQSGCWRVAAPVLVAVETQASRRLEETPLLQRGALQCQSLHALVKNEPPLHFRGQARLSTAQSREPPSAALNGGAARSPAVAPPQLAAPRLQHLQRAARKRHTGQARPAQVISPGRLPSARRRVLQDLEQNLRLPHALLAARALCRRG